MRWLPLVVSLAIAPLVVSPAHAQSVAAEQRAQASPVATVLEHRLDVVVDRAGKLQSTQTWRVRVDRPDQASAGILGPRGLDGARDGGAMMARDLLLIPASTSPGTVFTFTKTTTERKGPFSGLLQSAPGLPTQSVEVRLEVPSWVPLAFWSDPAGTSTFSSGKVRTITTTWSERSPGESARLVWSTWPDWVAAGAALNDVVDARVAQRSQLGPSLAGTMDGLRPAEAAERTYRSVELEEGPSTFEDARHTVQVVQSGHGTAAERAVVLISLLRAAGYDARPAMFRSGSEAQLSSTVPAPALLDRPGVMVLEPKRTTWIDTSNPHVSIPRPPASLMGGLAWGSGDLPVAISAGQTSDGDVAVLTEVKLARDGSAILTSLITASGTAEEWLRNYLSSLSDDGRTDIANRWVAMGRQDGVRVMVTSSGLESPRRTLKITIQAREEVSAQHFGPGLSVAMPPLLAPALAAWLPPNILVREEMTLLVPSGLQPLTLTQPPTRTTAAAVSGGQAWRDGSRLRAVYEVERPYRRADTLLDAQAEAVLGQASRDGATTLLLPGNDAAVAKAVRLSGAAEAPFLVAVEAAVWAAQGNSARVKKVLKKSVTPQSFDATLAAIARTTELGHTAVLEALADFATTDTDRLKVLHALERAQSPATVTLATALTLSTDPSVAIPATLVLARSPEAASNIDSALQQAGSLAAQASQGRALLGQVHLEQAHRSIDAEDWASASTHIDEAERMLPSTPRALAASALVGAHQGMPRNEVARRVDAAIAQAGSDDELLLMAARTFAELGQTRRAAAAAASRARVLLLDADAWSELIPYALADGDLGLALEGARRASSLLPTSAPHAQAYFDLAALAGEKSDADLAKTRGATGTLPESLDERITQTPPESLLAVLQYHDSEVVRSAKWLNLRAGFRLAAGDAEGAARDGTLLTSAFNDPNGVAMAFAATAGRAWSTSTREQLNHAARMSLRARAIRMEYDLIAGSGDARADALALQEDDPRSRIIAAFGAPRPNIAEQAPTWPSDLPAPTFTPPRGFRTNRILSAASGVRAFSNDDLGATLIAVTGEGTDLPPPLSLLFTAADVPIDVRPDHTLYELVDGPLPLFVAQQQRDGMRLLAVAPTEAGALRALALAK